MIERLLTVTDAAAYLCVCRSTLYRLMREGHVPFVTIPGIGGRRIRLSSLQGLVTAHEIARPTNGEAS